MRRATGTNETLASDLPIDAIFSEPGLSRRSRREYDKRRETRGLDLTRAGRAVIAERTEDVSMLRYRYEERETEARRNTEMATKLGEESAKNRGKVSPSLSVALRRIVSESARRTGF